MPDRKTPTATLSNREGVFFRLAGAEIPVEPGPDAMSFEQAAMQWSYTLRSRLRWASSPDLVRQHSEELEALLKSWGVDDKALASLARARIVEVSIPWSGDEKRGWAARIMPWEYLIAGASRSCRSGAPLTVARHLRRTDANPPTSRTPFERKVLFVVSAPGLLAGLYQFDTEKDLVKNYLAPKPENWRTLENPTLQELRDEIANFSPDIVHFAGFDTHEAVTTLPRLEREKGMTISTAWDVDPGPEKSAKDGYVLRGDRNDLRAVDAELLVDTLVNVDAKGIRRAPRLASFNFHSSGARVAALAVAHGVETAIGFQDSFDDGQAERFFSRFYGRLGSGDGGTADAFRDAWERIRLLDSHQRGTGLLRWSAAPLSEAELSCAEVQNLGAPPRELSPETLTSSDVSKLIKVTVIPRAEINYSILHNNKTLFQKFQIAVTRSSASPANGAGPVILHGVSVRVSLDVGGGAATYRRTLDIAEDIKELGPQIQLPLTSALTRAVHEHILTSMIVDVEWGKHVLHCDSHPVRLTPVDQWSDNEDDRLWLPSFVFPRDPATSRLIDQAQRYVRILRDDPASGFDGYQSFFPGPGTPTSAAEEVDLQVQAVWSAIVHDMRLTYINPPPGYSKTLDSQRLRTPSMIARYSSGTCIDLALFFAACLELIDIYPVIFLLSGHAFPGYWRSDRYHQEFKRAKAGHFQASANLAGPHVEGADAQTNSWFFKRQQRDEILSYVQDGKLVPIETVRLTENCGFWEAVDAGLENLRDPRDFEAMVDIKLARDETVTPLPILGAEE